MTFNIITIVGAIVGLAIALSSTRIARFLERHEAGLASPQQSREPIRNRPAN